MAAITMGANDNDDPVWLPQDPKHAKAMASTNQCPGHSTYKDSRVCHQDPGSQGIHDNHQSPDSRQHNGGRPSQLPAHYGTHNPHQSYSDIPPTTFKADCQGTWPRSGSRTLPGSRSQSGGSTSDRATTGLLPPTRGSSLHTISEHDHSRLMGVDVLPTGDPGVGGYPISGDPPPYEEESHGPSMTNGMSTTVPQSMVQHNLNCSHQPTLRRNRPSGIDKLTEEAENLEVRCCRITVLLVIMQIVLGTTITALGFYMERLTSSMDMRDCPYWAGIPVLMAGILGLYYCATDFAAYSGSSRAFIIKLLCFIFSTGSIFLCMVAAIFPGIHGHRISIYSGCELNATELTCLCRQQWDEYSREYRYDDIEDCVTVRTSVKDYLILQCALNAIASGVCLWFVTLLWKKRYEDFHSGLRFYSYSASVPPHPWSDPTNPPYFKETAHKSPLTVGRVSQRTPDTNTLRSSHANTQPNTLNRADS